MFHRASKAKRAINAISFLKNKSSKITPVGSSIIVKHTLSVNSYRFISSKPNEVFTKLSDENDPQRDSFFKYTWGSWLKNDKAEKEKRTTKFSLEGLNKILDDLYLQSKCLSIKDDEIPAPTYNKNLTVSLPHNILPKSIGTINDKVKIKVMSSIHEGKHHRIYKLDLTNQKSFILRIPYPMESEQSIAQRIKSEVASMDFADLKLNIKVPKTYCFGVNTLNPIRSPFILQEYIEGNLLMKKWNPLIEDDLSNGTHKKVLNEVICPLSDFQSKLASVTFTKFGSLYFAKDCKNTEPAYVGEENKSLQNRWKIGPTTEKCFWRKKSAMKPEDHAKFLGPWSNPLSIVKDAASVELENIKIRLAVGDANPNSNSHDSKTLKSELKTFDRLVTLAPVLFNTKSEAIPNVEDLFKPRLQHADLDPMNVLVTNSGEKYLLDFECSSIKPFILNHPPAFISYDGPKIFALDTKHAEYNKLSEPEKEQYKFMYKRTRNLFLWESALNERSPKLIYTVAPPVKMLKSPYLSAILKKTDEEYLNIDEHLIYLQSVWKDLAANKIVGSETYPVAFSNAEIEQHKVDIEAYDKKLMSIPFAATQGWIPQDMFDNLVNQKLLIKDENGDYKLDVKSV
ncbi:related to Altered inheritance of mitochondria protein 9, mitochondrial [Saccharomycodes ludwigii]|uniref:Altered inheritance of mitochondria protein 9, mitochondrial n=1 Tax=Saccharomycodes ludwigii TaxID=36035 RepID=A0A376B8S6_9ASCO|nr:related to Altered inheritance of mitochondria protein 9, mitochondrial [Saccharomycodes ludwigii]